MSNHYIDNFDNSQSKSSFKILENRHVAGDSKSINPYNILFGLSILALVFSSVLFINSLMSFAVYTPTNISNSPTVLAESLLVEKSSSIVSSSNSSVSEVKILKSIESLSSIYQSESSSANIDQSVSSVVSLVSKQNISLPFLSGLDFNGIYERTNYSNVLPAVVGPITDNLDVDNYIRSLGEARGYKLRPQALEANLTNIDGFSLQPEAANAWSNLRQVASSDGVNLVLTSGYRSIESQRSIFAAGLAPEYQVVDILEGRVDQPLQQVMNRVSLPGYSRHHTGYTIDVGCVGEGAVFKNTSCYEWMKRDNFTQARLTGFIPSYPSGVNTQGPNPEEWEFVWVGQT